MIRPILLILFPFSLACLALWKDRQITNQVAQEIFTDKHLAQMPSEARAFDMQKALALDDGSPFRAFFLSVSFSLGKADTDSWIRDSGKLGLTLISKNNQYHDYKSGSGSDVCVAHVRVDIEECAVHISRGPYGEDAQNIRKGIAFQNSIDNYIAILALIYMCLFSVYLMQCLHSQVKAGACSKRKALSLYLCMSMLLAAMLFHLNIDGLSLFAMRLCEPSYFPEALSLISLYLCPVLALVFTAFFLLLLSRMDDQVTV